MEAIIPLFYCVYSALEYPVPVGGSTTDAGHGPQSVAGAPAGDTLLQLRIY